MVRVVVEDLATPVDVIQGTYDQWCLGLVPGFPGPVESEGLGGPPVVSPSRGRVSGVVEEVGQDTVLLSESVGRVVVPRSPRSVVHPFPRGRLRQVLLRNPGFLPCHVLATHRLEKGVETRRVREVHKDPCYPSCVTSVGQPPDGDLDGSGGFSGRGVIGTPGW